MAKRLNVCSEFGKELDSLADLVSFGVAPALLIYYSTFAAQISKQTHDITRGTRDPIMELTKNYCFALLSFGL
uniref:CDP-alcohol phosphatidyltransferase family protein n=1 Tax=Paenibacillus lautus TaxID=1401 RepID=UPI0035576FE2